MTPGEALTRALTVDVPARTGWLLSHLSVPAIARLDARIPEGRLPARGTPARLRYDAARQKWLRYSKGTRKASKPASQAVIRRIAGELAVGLTAARARQSRGSCGAVVRATVLEDSPGLRGHAGSRTRTMPSGGHPVRMRDNGAWVDAFLTGQREEAGALFVDAFLIAYMGDVGLEVEDVEKITITREGQL